MSEPRDARCGRPDFPSCLMNRLASNDPSKSDPHASCDACHVTVGQLDDEIRWLGEQLAQQSSDTAFPTLSFPKRKKPIKINSGPAVPQRLSPEVGGYVLRELLGAGDLGSVYRATHKRLNKDVAIKLLSEKWVRDPCIKFQLDHEIRMLGKLEHPYLVTFTDAGDSGSDRYFVMDLIQGVNLAGLVDQLGRIDATDACEIARQVAIGMSYAHQLQLVHCDLKPANVMLDLQSPGASSIKVMDLGLSRVFQESLKTDSSIQRRNAKSIGFVAPEMASGSDADYRADIYSLGATLGYLLTGQLPCVDGGIDGNADWPPFDAPDGLTALLDQMMASDPEERPESMEVLAASLSVYAAGHDLESVAKRARDQSTLINSSIDSYQAPVKTAGPLAVENPPVARTQASLPPPQRGLVGSGRILLWMAVFALPVVVLISVLLWSSTDGGYVTIRADRTIETSVAFVQDGSVVDSIELNPDVVPVPTWFQAGQYELRLPPEMQSKLQIDGGKFTIKLNSHHVIVIRKR